MDPNINNSVPIVPSSQRSAEAPKVLPQNRCAGIWEIFKQKLWLAIGKTSVHGSASNEPPIPSAIQLLLGKTKNFKQLQHDLVNPTMKPKGELKARCKTAVNNLFLNMDTKGLSAKTVQHLYVMIKSGVYNQVCQNGEAAMPKTADDLADIWKNFDIKAVSPDRAEVIKEIQDRLHLSQKGVDVNAAFQKNLEAVSNMAYADDMGFGLRAGLFQQEVEELRDPSSTLTDLEKSKKIKQLLKKFPDIELSKDLRIALIKQAGEYLKNLPPHLQREQVFNMQATLVESAKIALLMGIAQDTPTTFDTVKDEFRNIAKKKLVTISKGSHPRTIHHASANSTLHEVAKASGLQSLGPARLLLDNVMGRRGSVAVPIGHGRIKHYDEAGVRALIVRHATVTGDSSLDHDFTKERTEALKEMFKDQALAQFIKMKLPERVENLVKVKYKNVEMTPEEMKSLREFHGEELTREMDDLLRTMEKLNPGSLEMHEEYREILQNLLDSYSVEEVRSNPKKYERFMDFMNVYNQNKPSALFSVASGTIANILRTLKATFKKG